MAEEHLLLPHTLTLSERSSLTMTGVTEVVSFDENTVMLHTGLGTLIIHGQNLQLKQLAPEGGQVCVEGSVTALIYEEAQKGGSWFRRLLG